MTHSYLLKLIVIGDTGVGKSNLLKQFTLGQFIQSYVATIGVQFGAKILRIRNINLKLQIWDTAGQEAFISITRSYFRAAIGALVVFDITNKESFRNLTRWISQAKQHSLQEMKLILLGNKEDLKSQREVSFEEAQKFAEAQGMTYFEVSAKSGLRVTQAFTHLGSKILQKIESGEIDLDTQFGVRTGPEYKKQERAQKQINLEINNPPQVSRCKC